MDDAESRRKHRQLAKEAILKAMDNGVSAGSFHDLINTIVTERTALKTFRQKVQCTSIEVWELTAHDLEEATKAFDTEYRAELISDEVQETQTLETWEHST